MDTPPLFPEIETVFVILFNLSSLKMTLRPVFSGHNTTKAFIFFSLQIKNGDQFTVIVLCFQDVSIINYNLL